MLPSISPGCLPAQMMMELVHLEAISVTDLGTACGIDEGHTLQLVVCDQAPQGVLHHEARHNQ